METGRAGAISSRPGQKGVARAAQQGWRHRSPQGLHRVARRRLAGCRIAQSSRGLARRTTERSRSACHCNADRCTLRFRLAVGLAVVTQCLIAACRRRRQRTRERETKNRHASSSPSKLDDGRLQTWCRPEATSRTMECAYLERSRRVVGSRSVPRGPRHGKASTPVYSCTRRLVDKRTALRGIASAEAVCAGPRVAYPNMLAFDLTLKEESNYAKKSPAFIVVCVGTCDV